MQRDKRQFWLRLVSAGLVCSMMMTAAEYTSGMKSGKAELQSAGVMAFGPDGILLVGDPMGAAIFAIDTGDRKSGKSAKIEEAISAAPPITLSESRYLTITPAQPQPDPYGDTHDDRSGSDRKRHR